MVHQTPEQLSGTPEQETDDVLNALDHDMLSSVTADEPDSTIVRYEFQNVDGDTSVDLLQLVNSTIDDGLVQSFRKNNGFSFVIRVVYTA